MTKKMIRKYLCVLFSVLILLNCGAIAIADPIDTTTTTTTLSYEAYFAEDRNIYVDNAIYPYIYIPLADGLYGYPRNEPESELKLAYRMEIQVPFVHDHWLFYTSPTDGGKTIYRYDANTKQKTTIYTATESVEYIDGNSTTIFFVSAQKLWRMYVPTGQVDLIATLPERFSIFRVVSNNRVLIYVLRQDWLDYVERTGDEENCPYEMEDVYVIDALHHTTTQISYEEGNRLLAERAAETDRMLAQIYAKIYGTETNASVAAVSKPVNFLRECILPAYNPPAAEWPNNDSVNISYNKTYKGAGTCVAFALEVYDNVFYPDTLTSSTRYCDKNNEMHRYSSIKLTTSEAWNRVHELEPGSIVKVRSRHWIILAGYDSNYVWVYHANLNGSGASDGKVRLHYMTYAKFSEVMENTHYAYHSKFNTSHTHSYSGNKINATGHDLRCSKCSVRKANSYEVHSFTPYYDGIEHYEICTICGYEEHQLR